MCHLPWIQVIWLHFSQVFRCSHCTLGIFTFSLSIQYCHVLVTEGDVNCWSVHERLSEASEKSECANRSVGGGNNQLNNNNEQRKNMRRLQSGKIYCSPMSSLTRLLLICSSAALPSVMACPVLQSAAQFVWQKRPCWCWAALSRVWCLIGLLNGLWMGPGLGVTKCGFNALRWSLCPPDQITINC